MVAEAVHGKVARVMMAGQDALGSWNKAWGGPVSQLNRILVCRLREPWSTVHTRAVGTKPKSRNCRTVSLGA